ncbi:hypothetical protein HPO00_28465 [Klebsiella pneumoniae]|nr:hypothetical protein [Klebsiella michiganensis]MBD7379976.1 hypothetical protein [Klebsiella pneumoniae]
MRSFRCRIRRLNDFELIRRPWEGRKTFKVIELKKEADNVTTVTFQSNSEGYLPDYEPGQHITVREGANKQVISSQADSLIKISRIWADFFPANTSNQPI